MRSSSRRIWIFIILVVVIAIGFAFSGRKSALSVTVAHAEKGIVEATVSNTRAGTVKACRRANLAPAGGGQVARLLVKEGDAVEQDQILLELWNDDLIAQLRLAEQEALASKQNAEETCLLADAAQREANRILRLRKDKLASEEQADNAETSAKARKAACKAARSRAEVADARVSVAQASLERTRLRAPFSGRVAEINGEVGEFVTPSPPGIPTPPAVDLVDLSCLYILAPIDEVDATAIVPGMEARITLDAFPDQSFLGAVRRIAPYVLEVEKQARTVDVEAVFMDENQYSQLLPGYSADLEVILDVRYDVLRVPTESVFQGDKVYVVEPDSGIVTLREIKTGLSNWRFTEVVEGLSEGDEVVLSIAREGLADGVKVSVESDKKI